MGRQKFDLEINKKETKEQKDRTVKSYCKTCEKQILL